MLLNDLSYKLLRLYNIIGRFISKSYNDLYFLNYYYYFFVFYYNFLLDTSKHSFNNFFISKKFKALRLFS